MLFAHRSYATINDLFHDVTGFLFPLKIYSFGFFVGLSLLIGVLFIYFELKRKAKSGIFKPFRESTDFQATTILLYVMIGSLAGYKLIGVITEWSLFLKNIPAYLFSGEGTVWGGLVGAIIAVIYILYKKQQSEKARTYESMYPHQVVGELTVLIGVSGVIGAKLFYFIEDPQNVQLFLQQPLEGFFSGLTIYGGLITGWIVLYFYTRKRKIPFLPFLDSAAPGLMLGYGIGRIGCHVSGDGDWGIVNHSEMPGFLSFLPEWLWAHDYPHNIINAGVRMPDCTEAHCYVLENAVYPTPIYEFIAAVFLFSILWSIRKKIAIPGMLFSVYLIFNGVERFLIEQIRVNPVYQLAGIEFTQAELISSLMVITGLAGVFLLRWFSKVR